MLDLSLLNRESVAGRARYEMLKQTPWGKQYFEDMAARYGADTRDASFISAASGRTWVATVRSR